MSKKNIIHKFGAFAGLLVLGLASLLPQYASAETSTHNFFLNMEGQGEVTISYNDETTSITSGTYSQDIEEGTEIHVEATANNSTIKSVEKDGEAIEGITDDITYYDWKYTMSDSSVKYKVSFKSGGSASIEADDETTVIDETDSSNDCTEEILDNDEVEEAETNKKAEAVKKLEKDETQTLVTKYLFVDKTKIADDETIDSIYSGEEGKQDAVLTQFECSSDLYIDEDGDYKAVADIPYLTQMASGDVQDYEFAKNDINGNIITDGVSFDKASKVATIDKSLIDDIQLQVMIPVDAETKATTHVKITNTNDNVTIKKTEFTKKDASFLTFATQIMDADSVEAYNKSSVTVKINGSDETLSTADYGVDEYGNFQINQFNGEVYDVDITIAPLGGTKRTGLLRQANRATGGTFVGAIAWLSSSTDLNQYWVGREYDTWARAASNPSSVYPGWGTPSMLNASTGVLDGQCYNHVIVLGLPKDWYGTDFSFRNANGSSIGDWYGYNLALTTYCHHVAVAAYSQVQNPKVTIRCLAKSTDSNGITTLSFAVETDAPFTCNFQTAGCTFQLKVNSKSNLRISKVSTDTSITDGNSLYTFEGAEYSVYSNSSCTNYIGKFTIGSDGYSNYLTLDPGTYYYKETKTPKGYFKTNTVYSYTLSAGKTVTVTGHKETPEATKDILQLVKKTSNSTGAVMAGVEFEVKHYAGVLSTDASALAKVSSSKVRTWHLKTDSNGILKLSSDYLVSGTSNSAFYTNFNGVTALVGGTLTIKETKTLDGYKLDQNTYYSKIDTNSNNTWLTVSNQNIKNDLTTNKAQGIFISKIGKKTSTLLAPLNSTVVAPLTGAKFVHTMPNGSTETFTTGSWLPNTTIDNKSDPVAYMAQNCGFEITNLAVGTHTVKEVSAPNQYYDINPNTITFVVNSDGSIDLTGGISDDNGIYSTKMLGNIYKTDGTVAKTGVYVQSISVYDKWHGYEIQVTKTDDNGDPVEGVEITAYDDSDCTNAIGAWTTDKTGKATIKITGETATKFLYFAETAWPSGYSRKNTHVWTTKSSYNQSTKTWTYTNVELNYDLSVFSVPSMNCLMVEDQLTQSEGNPNGSMSYLYYTPSTNQSNQTKYGNVKVTGSKDAPIIQWGIENNRQGPKELYLRKVAKNSVKVTDTTNYPQGTGTTLAGTTFTHTKPDGSKETLTYSTGGAGDSTLNAEGYMKITSLDVGTHTIKESKSVSGYQVNTSEIKFEVKSNGIIEMISESDSSTGVTWELTENSDTGKYLITEEDSKIDTKIVLSKVSRLGEKLKGAEFTLYSDPGCTTAVATKTSDSNGKMTFTGIEEGITYYLKETKAPDGYIINRDEDGNEMVYEIAIHKDASNSSATIVSINGAVVYNGSDGGVTAEGKEYNASYTTTTDSSGNQVDEFDMTITNKQYASAVSDIPLPLTGSMLGIGVVVIGIIIVFVARKKRGNR